MGRFIIEGPNVINGDLTVSGAKNSVLPALSAALLTDEKVYIHNCPDIRDVRATFNIIGNLGGAVEFDSNIATIDCGQVNNFKIPDNLMREMRSSIIFLGSMLARLGRAEICYPGGCELGPRPIDLHLSALSKMGANFENNSGTIIAYCDRLKGCEIQLDFPSVGATENIMLAAVTAEGKTVIHNVAREPEIEDLQMLLNKMGAKVFGAGSGTIEIEGVDKLHGTHHHIIGDRIVAATYLVAAAMTGGSIKLHGINKDYINSILSLLQRSGVKIIAEENAVQLNSYSKPVSLGTVRTMPYPGFPTDALALFMSFAAVVSGTTMFVETIFQDRYKHADELIRMGANIKRDGRIAIVEGVDGLSGANVVATDLRGGAAMVLAGIAANGATIIDNIELIERGYEDFDRNLQRLGCNIRKE